MLPMEMAKLDTAELQQVGDQASPFAVMKVGGATETSVYVGQWLTRPNVEEFRAAFMAIEPDPNGRITGQQAKDKFIESKLPSNVLHKVWTLSDVDKDGCLNLYEFALAMHFIKMRLDGNDLPTTLP